MAINRSFCTNCGTKIKNGESFCENCGAQLRSKQQKTTSIVQTRKLNRKKIVAGIICILIIGVVFWQNNFFSIERQLRVSYRLLNEDKYEEAIAGFEKITKLKPLNIKGYVGLSSVYAQKGEYEKALSIIEDVLAKELDSWELAHEMKVEIYLLQNEDHKAITFLKSINESEVLEYLARSFPDLFEIMEKEVTVVAKPGKYLSYFSPHMQAVNLNDIFIIKKYFGETSYLIGLIYRYNAQQLKVCSELIVLCADDGGYELRYKEDLRRVFSGFTCFEDREEVGIYALETSDKLLIKTVEPYPSCCLYMGHYLYLDQDGLLQALEQVGDGTTLLKHENGALFARNCYEWEQVILRADDYYFLNHSLESYIPEFTEKDFIIEVDYFKDVDTRIDYYLNKTITSGEVDFLLKVNNRTISHKDFEYVNSYDDDPFENGLTTIYEYFVDYDVNKYNRIIFLNQENYSVKIGFFNEEYSPMKFNDYVGYFEFPAIKPGEDFTIYIKTFYDYYQIEIKVKDFN